MTENCTYFINACQLLESRDSDTIIKGWTLFSFRVYNYIHPIAWANLKKLWNSLFLVWFFLNIFCRPIRRLYYLTNLVMAEYVRVKKMGPDFFQSCPVTGQGATGTNWNIGSSTWTWRKTSLLWGCQSTGTGSPKRLWNPAWIQSCASCSRWGCFSRRVGLCRWRDHLQGSLQPQPFCDSVKYKRG